MFYLEKLVSHDPGDEGGTLLFFFLLFSCEAALHPDLLEERISGSVALPIPTCLATLISLSNWWGRTPLSPGSASDKSVRWAAGRGSHDSGWVRASVFSMHSIASVSGVFGIPHGPAFFISRGRTHRNQSLGIFAQLPPLRAATVV